MHNATITVSVLYPRIDTTPLFLKSFVLSMTYFFTYYMWQKLNTYGRWPSLIFNALMILTRILFSGECLIDMM